MSRYTQIIQLIVPKFSTRLIIVTELLCRRIHRHKQFLEVSNFRRKEMLDKLLKLSNCIICIWVDYSTWWLCREVEPKVNQPLRWQHSLRAEVNLAILMLMVDWGECHFLAPAPGDTAILGCEIELPFYISFGVYSGIINQRYICKGPSKPTPCSAGVQ